MTDKSDPAVEGAWAYENLHVPAVFKQWAEPVLDAARVTEGDRVLDVACGTGVAARTALDRVGSTGSVTGLDVGPGMLAVAESIEPGVTWTEGDATDLPFGADEFDVVVSQFGLMFFPDRVQAVREMVRCTRPGGRIAVSVWDALERSAAYPTSVDILTRRAGPEAGDALRAPFVLGETDELRSVFHTAGAAVVSIETLSGTARFPGVRTMLEADLRGWLPVMGIFLDEELIEEILIEAESAFQEYVTPDGEMVFDAPAHVLTAEV